MLTNAPYYVLTCKYYARACTAQLLTHIYPISDEFAPFVRELEMQAIGRAVCSLSSIWSICKLMF